MRQQGMLNPKNKIGSEEANELNEDGVYITESGFYVTSTDTDSYQVVNLVKLKLVDRQGIIKACNYMIFHVIFKDKEMIGKNGKEGE